MPAGWKPSNDQAALGKEETLEKSNNSRHFQEKGSRDTNNNQLQSITMIRV